jgi:hypothetical protein
VNENADLLYRLGQQERVVRALKAVRVGAKNRPELIAKLVGGRKTFGMKDIFRVNATVSNRSRTGKTDATTVKKHSAPET